MARTKKFHAGSSLTITSNEPAFLEALREYGRQVVEVSGPRAINKTISNVRTRLTKEIGADYALKSGDGVTPAKRIKDAIRIRKAKRRQLTGEIAVDFRPLSLKYFDHGMTKEGVKARALKGSKRVLIPGAFGPAQKTTKLKLTEEQRSKWAAARLKRSRGAVMGGHIYVRTGVKTRPTRGYWVDWATAAPGRRVPMREQVRRLSGPSIRGRASVLFAQWRADGWLQERLAANIRQEAQGRVAQLRRQSASRGVRL